MEGRDGGQKLEENAEGTTEEDGDGETWRSWRVCDGWRDERCDEEEDEGMKTDRWIVMTTHWRVCVCVCAVTAACFPSSQQLVIYCRLYEDEIR